MIIEIPKKRLDKVDEIAIHNGFTLTEIKPSYTTKIDPFHPEEKILVIKNYKKNILNKKSNEPEMLYYDKPIFLNKKNSVIPKNYKKVGLDIIGIQNSIAEALIINTSLKILKEEGYDNLLVDLNCVGDKESISKFTDETKIYYKKNYDLLNTTCKKCLNKNNNIFFLDCDHQNCRAIQENAPRPINFLTEKSKQHFKEILEYLEGMNVPYRINDSLMSEDNHYSKTIFEIKMETENKNNIEEIILARGGRYDESANKIANKRNLSVAGVSLMFKKIKNEKAYSNQIMKPKIFLIQFGFMARIKSFEVIDILRQNKITIYQNLHLEKLTDQFDMARKMGIPNVIVIGHQEAQDNAVAFRNIKEATHEIIKIEKITQYLRKINII